MSSLRNILNPDDGRKRSVRLPVDYEPTPSTSELPSSPASVTSDHSPPEDPVDEVDHQDHEEHPNCPDTLDCLPDTDGRPQHTLPVILRCAILGSQRKRLTIRGIYAAMEGKYPYYKTAGPTWKQSVRHHLSLNRLFERQPRPATDPGFGSYWTVNLAAPPGTKRPRKRGRPNKDVDLDGASSKKRGRPRKDNESTITMTSNHDAAHEDYEMSHFDEDRDGGHHPSDEDGFESEEEVVLHPFERRTSLVGLSPYPRSSSSTSNVPRHPGYEEDSHSIIEKMQIEMAGLKRQSSDAVSLSIRLTDQLSQAQAESSRAKSALRSAEAMLGEETRKRRDAEQMADEEARQRRAAEAALRTLQQRLPAS